MLPPRKRRQGLFHGLTTRTSSPVANHRMQSVAGQATLCPSPGKVVLKGEATVAGQQLQQAQHSGPHLTLKQWPWQRPGPWLQQWPGNGHYK